jgi:hypothetical protein
MLPLTRVTKLQSSSLERKQWKFDEKTKNATPTFRSDGYPNIVLHAVKRYLNVFTEGPPQSFFDQSAGNDATIAEAAHELAPNMPPLTNDHSEDIQAFTATVDGDNLPAPENIPPPNEPLVWSGASNQVFPADG